MKIKYLIIAIVIIFFHWSIYSCKNQQQKTGEAETKKWFQTKNDSLLYQLTILDSMVINKNSISQLQQQFQQCRFSYKKIEAIVEYYFQGINKRINGPALPDIKTDDSQVWPPHGLQVIEQYLYTNYHDSSSKNLSEEVKLLKTDLLFVNQNMVENSILPRHLQEIIQHQLIRIATLGITGFDAPLSKLSIKEQVFALIGLEEIINAYTQNQTGSNKITRTCQEQINNSKIYLINHASFDEFDRMLFLKKYLMPLSEDLVNIPFKENIADSIFKKPFKGTLANLLTGKAFNSDYYTSVAAYNTNKNKVSLGKILFYDTDLSATKNLSCGSCHKPNNYFTDGLTKANNFVHGGTLARNTPTLYYAALQSNQFYDLRASNLEDQINEVMNNGEEFNLNANLIAKRINQKPSYKIEFEKAFGKLDSISGLEIKNAIACYVRSLSYFNSRFDEYMNGSNNSLTKNEINGFNLFTGKAKCATCHFVPLYNGNIPPWFTKSESEIIGVPASPVLLNAIIDKDLGRYNINKIDELKFAFKTPTVRNVEKTAPYMHNGVYKTLDEVVTFYKKGGGVGIGIKLKFQSLPFDSLVLNKQEHEDIIAFMKTLTDKP